MDNFRKKIEELIENKSKFIERKEEAWCIYYKGKRIKLFSNKSVWNKKQYAMIALSYQIKYKFNSFLYDFSNGKLNRNEKDKIYNKIIAEMVADGTLEFRQIK